MKAILSMLFVSISLLVSAQLTLTTNYREDGKWIESEMRWEIISTEEGTTVFNFNNELTSFRHITESISSSYQILEWDYDEDEVLYEMTVRSDAGNEYDFMIDGINEYVIFFYYDTAGNYRMVRHTIKETWFDE